MYHTYWKNLYPLNFHQHDLHWSIHLRSAFLRCLLRNMRPYIHYQYICFVYTIISVGNQYIVICLKHRDTRFICYLSPTFGCPSDFIFVCSRADERVCTSTCLASATRKYLLHEENCDIRFIHVYVISKYQYTKLRQFYSFYIYQVQESKRVFKEYAIIYNTLSFWYSYHFHITHNYKPIIWFLFCYFLLQLLLNEIASKNSYYYYYQKHFKKWLHKR